MIFFVYYIHFRQKSQPDRVSFGTFADQMGEFGQKSCRGTGSGIKSAGENDQEYTDKSEFIWKIFFENLLARRFSSSPRNFNALVKLNGEYIFQNLLGRKFWVIISSEFIALPQARSPVKTPPGAPFLNITNKNLIVTSLSWPLGGGNAGLRPAWARKSWPTHCLNPTVRGRVENVSSL